MLVVLFLAGMLALTAASPLQAPGDGYVSSQACAGCHRANHHSWHHSYHRRMTQLPSPEAVLAPFDGTALRAGPVSYRPRRGRRFEVEIMDGGGTVVQPLALVTGSHHMQLYWFDGGGHGLSLLPFAYLRDERRWVPRSAVFLQPPAEPRDFGLETGHWNTNCIQCHATHGRVSVTGRLDDLASRVAELGIACEACHGPGARHVRAHESGKPTPDAVLVDPRELPGPLSAQVCGQCHGILIERLSADFTGPALLARGHRYRPGDDITKTRVVARQSDPEARALLARISGSPTFWEDSFWPDGMVRVSGREYNGLVESPCAKSPRFSCLSCHDMHRDRTDSRSLARWADDQLAPGMDGDRACLQCHGKLSATAALVAHTGHQASSSGSRCMNCHMPYTTYGLLKAIRSHQVSSPSVTASLNSGRPNACNQCHLDRTLAWAAEALARRHGQPRPALTGEQQTTAASLLWLLRGDAGQRALMAWSFGWPAAQAASGRDWLAAHLAELLVDPYDAVRFIAHRSLRTLPAFARFRYDFVGPPRAQSAARERALAVWRRAALGSAARSDLLLGPGPTRRETEIARLLRQRDDRPVRLQE